MNMYEGITRNLKESDDLQEAINSDKEFIDSKDKLQRSKDWLKDNPDDEEVKQNVEKLEKDITDYGKGYDLNKKIDKFKSLLNDSTYNDYLKDYKDDIKTLNSSKDEDDYKRWLGWAQSSARDLNNLVSSIAKKVDPNVINDYGDFYAFVNNYLVEVPRDKNDYNRYANKHDDNYITSAASDFVRDKLSDKYGVNWRSISKDDLLEDVRQFTNMYNNANVEPEYVDEDFYGDEADYNKVFEHLITESDYEDYDEEDEDEEFIMYNPDLDKTVKVIKSNGKWVDSDGNRYMGYLSKSDVKSYFRGNWMEECEKTEVTESEETLTNKDKFIEYCKDKITDLGTVQIMLSEIDERADDEDFQDMELDVRVAFTLPDGTRYITSQDTGDFTGYATVTLTSDNKVILIPEWAPGELDELGYLEFTSIDKDYYDFIIENWESFEMDIRFESEELDNDEYLAVSDTDPQNENDTFDTKEAAIKYATKYGLDRVVKITKDDNQEEVWTKITESDEVNNIDLDELINNIEKRYIDDYEKSMLKYFDKKATTNFPSHWIIEKDGNSIEIDIPWGDWKHDHSYCDSLVHNVAKDMNIECVDKGTEIYEEDGSDTYSAIHSYEFFIDNASNINESDEIDEVAEFDKKLEDAGITHTGYIYFVLGAPDCHTIEDANNYYDSPAVNPTVNYKSDGKDITEEQFKLIDDNRELSSKVLHRAIEKLLSYGPLD